MAFSVRNNGGRRGRSSGALAEINCLTDMPWHRNWRMPQSRYARIWLFRRQPLSLMLGYLPRRAILLARSALRPAIVRASSRLRAWKARLSVERSRPAQAK